VKRFPYIATHDGGTSEGTVDAKNEESAENKIVKAMTDTETKKNKLKNLSVKIGEPIEIEEQ
jgi:hypothetical protein